MHRRPRRILYISAVTLVLITFAFPLLYPPLVTAQLRRSLDVRHGPTGWATLWCAADAQHGEQIALPRTLYVAFLMPSLQAWTPWRNKSFTHKTSTPNKPWHYVVCVITPDRETTYYWSMRKHTWIAEWENDTRQFPEETRLDYAKKLQKTERRNGLNWSTAEAN